MSYIIGEGARKEKDEKIFFVNFRNFVFYAF